MDVMGAARQSFRSGEAAEIFCTAGAQDFKKTGVSYQESGVSTLDAPPADY
jgi:hypothetical protein